MARGDGKAKKGNTRGQIPGAPPKTKNVKRFALGGNIDGPAPSNASSMRSGYAGGSTSSGNNFSGGGGGLGNSSREGGFAGAGVGRLESPAQRATSSPAGSPREGGFAGLAKRGSISDAYAMDLGAVPTVDAIGTPLRLDEATVKNMVGLPQTGLGPRQVVSNAAAKGDLLSVPTPTRNTMLSMARPSATPTSDYRGAPQAPAGTIGAAPASDYRGAPAARPTSTSAASTGDFRSPVTPSSADALNNAFQRKAAQFFAEGSPTGFRGTPGSQFRGGQVPGGIGGNALSAGRTGRPAETSPVGSGFPSGLADRQPGVTNINKTPDKIADRYPGIDGVTTKPSLSTPSVPPKPVPRPALNPEPSRPGFAADEPASDRGGGRGEGGGRRRHAGAGEGPHGRMAKGGLVSRGDGKCRVKTKGKMC